jgi:hypothetical protein
MKKLILLIGLLILLFSLSCSKSDEKDDLTITRCFVVKEIDTNIPIPTARVTLQEIVYLFDGSFGKTIAWGITDNNGEVCMVLSSNGNNKIDRILVWAEGYRYFDFDNPPSGYSEIYLSPILN